MNKYDSTQKDLGGSLEKQDTELKNSHKSKKKWKKIWIL